MEVKACGGGDVRFAAKQIVFRMEIEFKRTSSITARTFFEAPSAFASAAELRLSDPTAIVLSTALRRSHATI